MPTPDPETPAPPGARHGQWRTAALLGVGAGLANALLGRPEALGSIAPGTALALVALVLADWPGGIAAALVSAAGLLLSPDGPMRAAEHLAELLIVAVLARRVRSVILASSLFWLAVLPLAALAGALGHGALGRNCAAGLLGAALADAAFLVWSPQTLRGAAPEVTLWIDALPRVMLIVVTPTVAAGTLLTRFGVPLLPSVFLALLAGALSALALRVSAGRIGRSLRSITAAVGDPGERTGRGRRVPTRAIAPIRELREFASAVNAIQESVEYRDSTTGLPNRRLLEDRLAQAMARGSQTHESFALLHVDLDRYRLLDGSLGREAAEALLTLVARRIETCVGSGDTVARVGDDEFALLLPGVSDLSQAETFALSLMEIIRRPFTTAGREVLVTATVGLSLYPRDGTTPEVLLQNATAATHAAKQKGQDSYRRYTARVSAREVRRLALETGLRKALEADDLVLHFQPVVEIASGRTASVEALLRWRSSDGSLVSPTEFIPVAESSGLILAVDAWVLQNACAALRRFADDGLELEVSVNLSPRQFQQPDLIDQVKRALSTHGVAPARLGIEITERSALQDFDHSAETLRALRELGVKISVDDFGTGYSSLSYLRRLPVDTVKLDGSFVRELETNPDDAAISSAVIAMSHSLGLRVVAECVETEGQLRFLAQHGCDAVQGFLMSEPVPVDPLREFLARKAPLLPLV
jgi:diguanylate cyclase (GGDEF)-like protein